MGLTYNSCIIANVKALSAALQNGVGHYVLRVLIEFAEVSWPDRRLWVSDAHLRINVTTKEGPLLLGRALPESPFFLETRKYAGTRNLFFDLPVTAQQLSAIEELRAGKDLSFSLTLLALVGENNEIQPASETLHLTVSQSDWIRLLNDTRHADILLLEIPFGKQGTSQITSLLVRARDQINLGDYRSAVAQCRAVLEAIADRADIKQQQKSARDQFKTTAKAMTSEARLHLIREVVTHFTHPANHGDADSLEASYTRKDAMLLLTLTSALVTHGA